MYRHYKCPECGYIRSGNDLVSESNDRFPGQEMTFDQLEDSTNMYCGQCGNEPEFGDFDIVTLPIGREIPLAHRQEEELFQCPCGAIHSASEWNENSRRRFLLGMTEIAEYNECSFYCPTCDEMHSTGDSIFREPERLINRVGGQRVNRKLVKGDKVVIIQRKSPYEGARATVVATMGDHTGIEFIFEDKLKDIVIEQSNLKKVGE